MDTKQIRQLLKENAAVVLVEEGHAPLIVRELQATEEPQEVPISARWPKSRPPAAATQDSVLERLNNEILALKEQIALEEQAIQAAK
ncbi:MAG: hypothetical protein KBC02_02180 [Candidatus Pacebacteria bacterium]|nr:hypothetical protein [Candidatus Paceibacterota bacterium]